MDDTCLLPDANLTQINDLLKRQGKEIHGPKDVKAAWLNVFLTNAARSLAGEVIPFYAARSTVGYLKTIKIREWMYRCRQQGLPEEDVEQLLLLGIYKNEHFVMLEEDCLMDASINPFSIRTIKSVMDTFRPPQVNALFIRLSSSGETDSEFPRTSAIIQAFPRPKPKLVNNGRRYPPRPFSKETIDKVLIFMIQQIKKCIEGPTQYSEDIERYARTIITILLELLAGKTPFYRVLQAVGAIWNIINDSAAAQRIESKKAEVVDLTKPTPKPEVQNGVADDQHKPNQVEVVHEVEHQDNNEVEVVAQFKNLSTQ